MSWPNRLISMLTRDIVSFVKRNHIIGVVFLAVSIIILAVILRLFVFELYVIPSGSMENTLYTGDKIIVSKLQYGPRLPRSGFEIPWLNLFWFLNPKARADMGKNEWGYKRLSGYSKIKHNDVLVFNYPGKMFEFFIKRCVALPGDSLQIINGQLQVNNLFVKPKTNIKSKYKIYHSNYRKLKLALKQLNIPVQNYYTVQSNKYRTYNISQLQKEKLSKLPFIDSIIPKTAIPDSIARLFPFIDSLNWTIDNYGPILIPAKGTTVKLNQKNYGIYIDIINKFEDTDIVNTDSGFYIGNKPIKTYRFKQNYYFMMGDNRHRSMDSRYWGFVPESHIVGKAVLVLFSYNEGFKWDRFFKLVD